MSDSRSEDPYKWCGINYFATGRTLTIMHTKATVFLYFQLLSLSMRAILICVDNITFPAVSIKYVLHL